MTYDADGFYLDPTTNSMGIGTTAPTDELHVQGDIRATSGLHLGSDISANYFSSASTGAASNTFYIGNESILASGDIGGSVQGYDSDLATIAGLSNADNNIIVGSPTGWVVESGSTARTSLGLGTGDSPTFTDLTLSSLLTDGVVYSTSGNLNSEQYLNVTRGGTGAGNPNRWRHFAWKRYGGHYCNRTTY